MSRYNEDEIPEGSGYVPDGEQCDFRCLKCKKPLGHLLVPSQPGINIVVAFLERFKVLPICNECFDKEGIKVGKMPLSERVL